MNYGATVTYEDVVRASEERGLHNSEAVWVDVKCGRTLEEALDDQADFERDPTYLRELLDQESDA